MTRIAKGIVGVAAISLLAALGSCAVEESQGPRTSGVRRLPGPMPISRLIVGGEELFHDTFSPTNSNVVIGPITMDTLHHNTLVLAQVSGMLTETTGFPGGYAGHGSVGPGGWVAGFCYGNVSIQYPNGAGAFCNPWVPGPTAYLLAFGAGTVGWRQGWYSGLCGPGNQPCWNYSGSFEITITRVAVDAELQASPRSVTTPQSITFTAQQTPSTAGGVGIPFQVVGWWYEVDGDTTHISTACGGGYSNPTVCNYTPPTSGTMYAAVIANGVEVILQVHIDILSCLTGDSFLDDSRVRRGIKMALDGSHLTDPAANRMERFGGLFRDATGRIIPWLFPEDAGDGPCWNDIPSSGTLGAVGTIIVTWHTHPFRDDGTDPLPYVAGCPTRPPGLLPTDPRPAPGDQDYVANPVQPWIVASPTLAHVTPGGGTRPDTKTYSRSACDYTSSL